MSSFYVLFTILSGFLLTYALHSTILLSACWLVVRLGRIQSPAAVAAIWKYGLVISLLSPTLALLSSLILQRHLGIAVVNRSEFQLPATSSFNERGFPRSQESGSGDHPVVESTDTAINQRSPLLSGDQSALLGTEVPDAYATEATVVDFPSHHPPHAQQSIPEASSKALRVSAKSGTDNRLDVAMLPVAGWKVSWMDVVTIAAIAIGSIGLVRFGLNLWQLHRFQQCCHQGTRRQQRIVRDIAKQHRSRRDLRIFVSSEPCQPFVLGWFKPLIIIPAIVDAELNQRELRALIMHEVGHFHRGDVIWQWFMTLACHGLAFQPLNWVARKQWQTAAETLADQWSTLAGVPAIDLAHCLVRVAELFHQPGKSMEGESPVFGMRFMTKHRLPIVQRVERLLSPPSLSPSWESSTSFKRSVTLAAWVGTLIFSNIGPHCLTAVEAQVQPIIQISSPGISVPSGELHELWQATQSEMDALTSELERLVIQVEQRDQSETGLVYISTIKRLKATLEERERIVSELLTQKELP